MKRLLLILLLAAPAAAQEITDTDGDGILDLFDNCVLVANPSQVDADSDGCGNVCDADYDQNGAVGVDDFNLMRSCIIAQKTGGDPGPPCDVVDMVDDDGRITEAEVRLFAKLLGAAPGPGVGACF